MRVVIGSDHAGFRLKAQVGRLLAEDGHDVVDVGTESEESTDYPDHGRAASETVARGDAEFGIVICGTGLGMSMVANKVEGVRAARCTSEFDARLARLHNDANVLAMGERVTGPGLAEAIVRVFLSTGFEGGRHARRVDKIENR
jgi:ribose 5-phosphate isomerase B